MTQAETMRRYAATSPRRVPGCDRRGRVLLGGLREWSSGTPQPPTRQSGHPPAQQQSRNAKRSADSVGRPSRKIEAKEQVIRM